MATGYTFRRRGARLQVKPMATINVTSLLDITMVLLIAFMIVAPALNYGLDVRLPEVQASAVPSENNALVISVAVPDGKRGEGARVFLGQERVDTDQLKDRLESLRQTRERLTVIVQGDKDVPWEEMAKVIGAVQQSGVEGVSLLTTPPTD